MGKTTLWRAGVAAAESAGHAGAPGAPGRERDRARRSRAIGDLLDPVLDEALESLPGRARSRALSRGARARGRRRSRSRPARGRRRRARTSLRALAASGPLVVAIDDVQWLDAASAGALAYAARRLRDGAGRRAARAPVGARERARRRAPAIAPVERLRGGRRRAARRSRRCTTSSRAQLDVTLPRPLLAEVHQASGGNPFYALEIVRTLQRTRMLVEAGQPLPAARLAGRARPRRDCVALPEDESRLPARRGCARAADARARSRSATGVAGTAGLAPALEARVVELDGDRIRFTHPLLAAGAYEIADPSSTARGPRAARRARSTDPEARAWQLAAAVDEPDASVAAVARGAAQRARARGAPRAGSAAARARRRRSRRPATESHARRRSVEAAYAHHAAGDTDRARALLERDARTRRRRAPSAPGSSSRWRASARTTTTSRGASELYRQAIAEADAGIARRGVRAGGRGGTLFRLRERLDEAVDASAERAATSASRARGDAARGGDASRRRRSPRRRSAGPRRASTAEAALAFAGTRAATARSCGSRVFAASVVRFWHDDLHGSALERTRRWRRREGARRRELPAVRARHARPDRLRARSLRAALASRGGRRVSIAEQAGQRTLLAYALAVRRGRAGAPRPGRASAACPRSAPLELARQTSGVPAWIFATLGARPSRARARRRPRRRSRRCGPLVEHHARERIERARRAAVRARPVEALVESGRARGRRGARSTAYEAAAAAARTRVARSPRCARCRGLLAAHDGDLDGALGAFEAAVEWHREARRCRSIAAGRSLALGATQRRRSGGARRGRRSRRRSRVFEAIGAALWAERARAELKRISGRAATPGALTPAEERVAALVAEGKTNREVAAALFLSDRTVEGHLARIFGKLGIRHRAEVAGRTFKHRGSRCQTRGTRPFQPSRSLPSLESGGHEGHQEQRRRRSDDPQDLTHHRSRRQRHSRSAFPPRSARAGSPARRSTTAVAPDWFERAADRAAQRPTPSS